MDLYDIFFYLSIFAGFLMAFNLGANDVANAMASAVGAEAITVKQAVMIAACLNFVGAVFLGSHVTATISKGIINADKIKEPTLIMLGMFASLLAAAIWVFIATLTALPVSSTHSIIGSILGFGLVIGGPDVVNWGVLARVVLSWIISPLLASLISFLVFTHIRKFILFHKQAIHQTKKWVPFWVVMAFILVIFSFFYKTPLGKKLTIPWWGKFLLAIVVAFCIWMVSRYIVGKIIARVERKLEGKIIEGIFRKIQIGTSCYVALSQGANDVANAIGPVVAVYMIAKHHMFMAKADIPFFILALGGGGIALGIMCFGRNVIQTVGKKITELTNTRGFSVDFGAATTVLGASILGMPVSTTHAAVGGVVGVGLARGFSAVDLSVLVKIVIYWVLTVPIAAFTSIVIFQILRSIVY